MRLTRVCCEDIVAGTVRWKSRCPDALPQWVRELSSQLSATKRKSQRQTVPPAISIGEIDSFPKLGTFTCLQNQSSIWSSREGRWIDTAGLEESDPVFDDTSFRESLSLSSSLSLSPFLSLSLGRSLFRPPSPSLSTAVSALTGAERIFGGWVQST